MLSKRLKQFDMILGSGNAVIMSAVLVDSLVEDRFNDPVTLLVIAVSIYVSVRVALYSRK